MAVVQLAGKSLTHSGLCYLELFERSLKFQWGLQRSCWIPLELGAEPNICAGIGELRWDGVGHRTGKPLTICCWCSLWRSGGSLLGFWSRAQVQKDQVLSGIVRTWRRVLGPETRGGAVPLAGESLSISGLCGLGLCSRSLLVWLVWSVCY